MQLSAIRQDVMHQRHNNLDYANLAMIQEQELGDGEVELLHLQEG